MQKLNTDTRLRDAILELEKKQSEEQQTLKAQFHLVYDSVKPINLVRNTVKDFVASQDIKEDILNITIGMATSYLSKLIIKKESGSSLKKLLGSAFVFGVTYYVANNPEKVKSLGKTFLSILSGNTRNKDISSPINDMTNENF